METFRKIYINSVDDLPKENDPFLLAHFKKDNEMDWYPFKKGMEDLWMKSIDWYLQPITEEYELITPEEILNKMFLNDDYFDIVYKPNILKAMKEYASQFQPVMPSDEIRKELINVFSLYFKTNDGRCSVDNYIEFIDEYLKQKQ